MNNPLTTRLEYHLHPVHVTWRPAPIPPPCLDPDVVNMPALRRTSVILHYRIAALEYAVSPGGTLRAGLRMCTLLGLLLGALALFVLPPIVLLCWGLADAAAALASTLLDLLRGLLALLAIIAIGAVLVAVGNKRKGKK